MSESIEAISVQEAVRKRPTMYAGPLETAHYQILWEFLCLARESACCRDDIKVKITLHAGGKCKIEFTGALPTEVNSRGIPSAERMLTELGGCRAANPKDRQEFCLMGIMPSNCLCSDLDLIIITKEGKRYFQFYSCGKPTSKLEASSLSLEADPDTTIFKFRIDPTILPDRNYDYDVVVDWAEKNLLNIETTIFDTRTGNKITFKNER